MFDFYRIHAEYKKIQFGKVCTKLLFVAFQVVSDFLLDLFLKVERITKELIIH